MTLAVNFNNAGCNPIDNKYTAGFDATAKSGAAISGVGAYVPLIGDEADLIISSGFEK